MRQNLEAQFVQLLKCWLCNVWLGVVVKNWALSADQCQLQALQFLLLNDDYYYYFLISSELTRHSLTGLFHLSGLLQMPNDHRMVNIQFFSSFSFSCRRISFDDGSQLLSTSDSPQLHSSSSKLLSPLQNFLNHHCTVHLLPVPGPNVLLMLWVISSVLQPSLNLIKKITQICFLSNIISIV